MSPGLVRNGSVPRTHRTGSPCVPPFPTFDGKEKHVKLFICKTERRTASAGMIHSSHGVLIGQKAAATAAVEDYFAKRGGAKRRCARTPLQRQETP